MPESMYVIYFVFVSFGSGSSRRLWKLICLEGQFYRLGDTRQITSRRFLCQLVSAPILSLDVQGISRLVEREETERRSLSVDIFILGEEIKRTAGRCRHSSGTIEWEPRHCTV